MKTNLLNNAKWLLVVAFATLSAQLRATDVTFTGSSSGGWTASEAAQSGTKSGVKI